MNQPQQLGNPLYSLVHNEHISAFNPQNPRGVVADLTAGGFRGLDRHNAQRQAAHLVQAQISGACFSVGLSADEALAPVNVGSCLRYRSR